MKMYFGTGAVKGHDINVLKDNGVERTLFAFSAVNCREDLKFPFPDVMMDSGAYSVGMGKSDVSVRTYSLWLQINLSKYPQIKTYVNFDDMKDPVQTQKNQELMESDGLKPLPVYHYGEDIKILDKYCDKYEYVGIGGLVANSVSGEKLRKMWELYYEKYPDNKFHLFGVGSLNPLVRYQPYSIDSVAWIYYRSLNSIAGYNEKGLPDVMKLGIKDCGWSFFFDYKQLSVMNIKAMLDWEKLEWLKNVKLNEEDLNQARLF